jgi:hypothetical protein
MARGFGQPRTALGVMVRVFRGGGKIVSNQERATADLMITPKVGHIRWDQTRRSEELVALGYDAGLRID